MTRVERFDPDFAIDVIEATAHYDKISIDLGNRFRAALREALVSVRKRPESFGYTRRPSRGAMLAKFPYVIVFRATDSTLFFGGCFHSSSDPERWRHRMVDNPSR
ncbi:hypothetical protein [Roseimaritima sediminicola]|uniref:hypothetical protein n=1 Tax=Roseimaritima sediminicola TaxID=2662066 RepID=UPI0012982A22|nr:hypothetical protein [Roseimaritima sediminicola]